MAQEDITQMLADSAKSSLQATSHFDVWLAAESSRKLEPRIEENRRGGRGGRAYRTRISPGRLGQPSGHFSRLAFLASCMLLCIAVQR